MRIRGTELLLAVWVAGGCGDMMAADSASLESGVLQLVGYGGTRPAAFAGAPDRNVAWDELPDGHAVLTPPEVIAAPATVLRGEPFHVGVHTIGRSGCWRADRLDAVVAVGVVELRPYDRHSGAEFCTGVLLDLVHGVTLTLDEPGEWTLLVHGRRVHEANPGAWVAVTAAKTIVVQ